MESQPPSDPLLPYIQEITNTLGASADSRAESGAEAAAEVPVPMHARRPAWLIDAINAEFANLPKTSKGYSFLGLEADYRFGVVPATEIIRQYREQAQAGGPLRILDVGTGAGVFVTGNTWQEGDIVHGLTGEDYRQVEELTPFAPALDDSRYIVGNAECLNAIPELLPKYDIIVSKMTYVHFVDEIGALEQIANRVVRGGLLCLQLGLGNRTLPVRLLQQHGFEFVDVPDANQVEKYGCPDIVMRRVGDPGPIAFDVEYRHATVTDISDYDSALSRQITVSESNPIAWGYETDDI